MIFDALDYFNYRVPWECICVCACVYMPVIGTDFLSTLLDYLDVADVCLCPSLEHIQENFTGLAK